MRNFLSALLANLILLALTWGVGTLVYLNFPSDGFSARPIATILVALILVGIAIFLLMDPVPTRGHILGGMGLGAAATGLTIWVGVGEGWSVTGQAAGYVLLVLVWTFVFTLVEYRIITNRWPW